MSGNTLSELVRALPNYRDTEAIAVEVIHELENLKPKPLPPRGFFSNKDVLRKWQSGGEIPDALREEFAAWLSCNQARSREVSENERKLRSTTWAQWRLRGTTYEPMLAEFHRLMWGIEQVEYESDAREQQVQARVRHGVV